MSRSDLEPLEPLSPELTGLLDAERTRPDPPPAMRSRILERLGGELLDSVPPGTKPPGGSAAAPTVPPTPAVPSLRLGRLPLALTMLVAGGVGGAALHALLRPPVQTTVYVPIAAPPGAAAPTVATPPPAPPPATSPAVVPAPTPDPRREPTTLPRRPAPAMISAPPPPSSPPAVIERERQLARDRDLAAERGLLEQARTALARGKPDSALGVLARHEHDFPRGQLIEEREALRILSLAADHQTEAARARAAKFRQAFPHSMLIRTIESSLPAEP